MFTREFIQSLESLESNCTVDCSIVIALTNADCTMKLVLVRSLRAVTPVQHYSTPLGASAHHVTKESPTDLIDQRSG